MRKVFVSLVVATIIFSSCGKEEELGPIRYSHPQRNVEEFLDLMRKSGIDVDRSIRITTGNPVVTNIKDVEPVIGDNSHATSKEPEIVKSKFVDDIDAYATRLENYYASKYESLMNELRIVLNKDMVSSIVCRDNKLCNSFYIVVSEKWDGYSKEDKHKMAVDMHVLVKSVVQLNMYARGAHAYVNIDLVNKDNKIVAEQEKINFDYDKKYIIY